jgi:hypothetical protein
VVDRAVGAFNVGRASLTVLAMALDEGRPGIAARLDTAVSSAERARGTAETFLEMASKARVRAKQGPPRFRVTCPECGRANLTTWNDEIPPGGVNPVRCEACGYMIQSESEGNPSEVGEEGDAASTSGGPAEPKESRAPDAVRLDGAVNLTGSQKIAAINELCFAAWQSGVAGTESLGESDNYVAVLGGRLEEEVEDARHFFAEALERTEIVQRLIRSRWTGPREQCSPCESGIHEGMRSGDQKRRAERLP